MKTLRGAVLALCAVLVTVFGTTLAPGARADQWDKKTIVTFQYAVEIPGKVLQPGTYVFKLADTVGERHYVQIWNADESEMLTMVRTIPNARFETPERSLFEFEEREGSLPRALKVWFFPGNNMGEEFVYSRNSYSYNH